MPGYVVGENHEDHQAACVLATEAFDMAGDPLVFPEQLTAPRKRLGIDNYGEGLRAWQPKKIYYFSDATDMSFLKGKDRNTRRATFHRRRKFRTLKSRRRRGDFTRRRTISPMRSSRHSLRRRSCWCRGKSLVGGTVTGDIFEGVTPTPIAYHPPVPHDPKNRQPAFELGGPWSFYRMFAVGHDLKEMQGLYTAEAQVAPGDTLWVPLLIRNDTDAEETVAIQATLPNGWTQKPADQSYVVGPHDVYSVQLTIKPNDSDKGNWQNLSWTATADGKQLGTAALRVQVISNGLPQ